MALLLSVLLTAVGTFISPLTALFTLKDGLLPVMFKWFVLAVGLAAYIPSA